MRDTDTWNDHQAQPSGNMMRILLCGINYAPDLIGVSKFNTELCEWLQSKGHEVHVVTAPPYYPEWKIPERFKTWMVRSETKEGVFVKRAPIYVPKNPSGARRLLHHASFALTSAWPVIVEAYRWRPHLLMAVAPSLISCTLVASVARRRGAKSWLHLQDFEIDAAFNLGLLKQRFLHNFMLAIERRILSSFDRVSTISPQMLRRLHQKGIGVQHTYELRNWVDINQITPGDRNTSFREILALSESDLVALYSGSMSSKQGLDLIIESARELEKSHPNVHFILCGEGPQKLKLQKMAANLRNVHFVGLQSDDLFGRLLRTADFHLLPQRAEAADLVLPSKIGCILASGRPVIAMADPGTGLASEIEGASLVVSSGNAQGFTEAIKTVAGNADLRRTLSVNARQRAEQRWNKTVILHSLERELLTLCDQNDEAARVKPGPPVRGESVGAH
jgi:colanic acid biosynthesis glycosyl transferase WcaI